MKRLTIHALVPGLIFLLAASCTAPPQTVTICKNTTPAGGTGFQFLRSTGNTSLPNFTLSDSQCQSFNLAGQDHFNKFTETVPAGWTLTNISCSFTTSAVKIIGANANPTFQPGDNTVTIDLNEANVTCKFLNQQTPCCAGFLLDISTGQGGGAIDPLWTINSNPTFITPAVSGWIAISPAQWIQPVPTPTPATNVATGVFAYVMNFNLAPCPTGHFQLSGTFAADNDAQAMLDGVAIPGAACPGPTCFNTPQAPVPLNLASIAPGPHTLEIDVNNSGGATGLIVQARIAGTCP